MRGATRHSSGRRWRSQATTILATAVTVGIATHAIAAALCVPRVAGGPYAPGAGTRSG
jgi:hypothetical protein